MNQRNFNTICVIYSKPSVMVWACGAYPLLGGLLE